MNFNPELVLPWVLRCAWLFIIIQWADIIRQLIALKTADLSGDVSNAEAAKAAAAAHDGNSIISCRARALYSAFAAGWTPGEVAELASHQSHRYEVRNRAGGLFMLLVFVACIGASIELPLPWIGIAALGATLFARSLLLGRIDHVLDTDLVTRLPGGIPGAGITAADLGKALGGSIENAFKQYVPQPEKVATALTAGLDSARKAIESAADKINTALAGGGDKLSSGLVSSGERLVAGLAGGGDKLASSLASGAEKLHASLASPAQQIEKAAAALGAQADKLLAASANLEKLIASTNAVDGALRSISGAEEFKKTLVALQTHLAESDKLVREATKPRTIRLVEQEGEIGVR